MLKGQARARADHPVVVDGDPGPASLPTIWLAKMGRSSAKMSGLSAASEDDHVTGVSRH